MHRHSKYFDAVGTCHVSATREDHPTIQVAVCFQHGDTALSVTSIYLSAEQARAIAANLIASADHYDAETARLAQQAAA